MREHSEIISSGAPRVGIIKKIRMERMLGSCHGKNTSVTGSSCIHILSRSLREISARTNCKGIEFGGRTRIWNILVGSIWWPVSSRCRAMKPMDILVPERAGFLSRRSIILVGSDDLCTLQIHWSGGCLLSEAFDELLKFKAN